MKRKFHLPLIVSLLLVSFYHQSSAQLYINEFMASNTGVVLDPDNEQSADWIELYNKGNSPVDLGGYYLTDNLKKTKKWKIPAGIQIAANGYLLFWADTTNHGFHTNFALSASGEQIGLSDKSGVLIDSVEYGVQDNALFTYGAGSIVALDSTLLGVPDPNISMGRKPDGSSDWVLFTTPTPGASNTSVGYKDIVKSDPGFSLPGGVYPNAISLEIKSIFGGDVRYTLDGTEPDEKSNVTSSAINITKNTVVRARIFKTGQIPGPITTYTYLIDTENKISNLPIVCLSSDPANFWDPVKGIYTVHSEKPKWEIPVNIELYENDGRTGAAFNLKAGIKSTGLYSWQLPEKMLGVSFRKEYGAGKLEYPLIFDKSRKVYDTFSLRASGSDWGNTMFRDGMIQTSAILNTQNDDSGFRACVVYINGEYMGIHNIREKIDEDYIVGNHGLKPGSFDMIEETDSGHYAETGDYTANDRFVSLYKKDLTIQSNFDALAAEMDLNNFTDMVCSEVYSGNSSISHNLMKYKPKDSGKWKWILMDFDRGFEDVNSNLINFYVNNVSSNDWPLQNLMNNTNFKKQFGVKLANLLFTTFNANRIVSQIEEHKKTIEDEMPNHIERWSGTHGTGNYSYIYAISSMEYWLSEVEKLKTFAKERPGVILNDLTNYGFQSPVSVTVSTIPSKAGNLTFNGLKIPVDVCSGGYPKGEEIKFAAEAKEGYKFKDWENISSKDSILLARESNWKYSDTGANPGSSWKNADFNDSVWKTGQAELGYGDGDEKTLIGYGGDDQNKYITSYFRKSFVLSNTDKVTGLTLSLKCDDGTVIYLNGNEIHRYNMPSGAIEYETLASSAISGNNESDFHTFSIGSESLINGNNIVAVEVHQSSSNSSDVSFDLELAAQLTGSGTILTSNKEYVVIPQSALNIAAVFESEGKCILPGEISTEMTLHKDCSPYIVPDDVKITSTGKLIIEPGVEIWMSDGVNIFSSATILAKGTESEPIIFRSNPESKDQKWGIISIKNANDTIRFKNVIIENASEGPNPVRDIAALAIENSTIILDSIYIENIHKNPLNVYNCQTSITNSRIHSDYAGCDEINIKRGKILINHCEFRGNTGLDSDALDFGEMSSGNAVVKNSYFHDMDGYNSDAVDLGDHAKNIIVDSIVVYNFQDKGVSIGQQSSAKISNSIFMNCGMGAGMKDSSSVKIDHCTYYGNFYALANYQKHPGDAGSNLVVTNSILSNSYELGYFNDEYSAIHISNSLDDTEKLPSGNNNLHKNPLFTNPTFYDFSLQSGSPLIDAGTDGTTIGANLKLPTLPVSVMITDIAYVTEPGTDNLEFIGLYNPGDSRMNLDSCSFKQGFTFMFPAGASIGPKEKIYITSNSTSSFWQGKGAVVYQWESGRLADEGESIRFVNKYGKVIDQVIYNNKAPWPVPTKTSEGITLTRFDVDNHFGEYWKILTTNEMVSIKNLTKKGKLKIYPNPAKGWITVEGDGLTSAMIEVYNLSGLKVYQEKATCNQQMLNLDKLQKGVYILKTSGQTRQVILIN
ncbi:MAG TPA: lamin tail domain-containing protein [Prolixibacteraceae bacterium]|nr:lamin tail domain-containing protein [Prolixibacteraceae bacterium]